MDIKLIAYENVPCWYELSFWESETGPSVILRIHKDFIKSLKDHKMDLRNSFLIKSFQDKFKIASFSGDFNGDIGFGGVLKNIGEKDGFIGFEVKVPKIIKTTGTCNECKGTGNNGDSDISCGWCRGTGIGRSYDWSSAYAISASFTIVFGILFLGGCHQTSSSSVQLMEVRTTTENGMHGGSLYGHISIPLKEWIQSVGEAKIPEMVHAMETTYDTMMGKEDYHRFSFNAYARERGGFTTSCPGDACGLHPTDWNMSKGKGYEYSCHNVDTPAQQLTLLAGLAALHDRVRKEIKI